jgi:hypothetical protein
MVMKQPKKNYQRSILSTSDERRKGDEANRHAFCPRDEVEWSMARSQGIAFNGDGGAAGAAERRARPLLPGDVAEEDAHLGDLVLVRLVHLGLVLLLLDPPHLAVHHLPSPNVLVSHLLLLLHLHELSQTLRLFVLMTNLARLFFSLERRSPAGEGRKPDDRDYIWDCKCMGRTGEFK